jgi:hypothetical protein
VHAQRGLVVPGAVAGDGVEDADVVDDAAYVREQVADHDAAAAARPEAPVGPFQEAVKLAGFALPVVHGDGLAGVGEELRLVVEGIDVRGAAGREDEDHLPGPGGEVPRPGGERVGAGGRRLRLGPEAGQRQGPEAAGRPVQQLTPCHHGIVLRRQSR